MNHVLILFQASSEHVEQMALAVAVGAVEAEGLIRLRRLAAEGAPEVGHRSYGRLQAADLSWATTIVVGLEDPAADLIVNDALLTLLRSAKLPGVNAWTFSSEGFQSARTAAQLTVEKGLVEAEAVLYRPEITEDLPDLLDQLKQAGRQSRDIFKK
jgi:hypothetical protein